MSQVRGRQSDVPIHDGQVDLVLDMKASRLHFVQEAGAHRTFEYTGTQRAVDTKRALDDGVTRLVRRLV